MTIQINKWWVKIEPIIVLGLLLYAEAIDLGPDCPIPFPPNIIGLLNTSLYGFVGLLFLSRWKRIAFVATKDWLLWLLVGTAIVSFLWSSAPDFSKDESKAVLRSVLFGAYIATTYTPKEQMGLIARICGIAAVLSLLSGLLFPNYGIQFVNGENSWKGIYLHKQYLGRMMTLGGMTFWLMAMVYPKSRWLFRAAFILCVILIILSRSKTSLLLLVLSLLLIPLYNIIRQRYKTKAFLLLMSVAISGTFIVTLLSNIEWLVVDVLGKNLEFNGRLPVWNLAIEAGMKQPWLGYGYAGFWTSDASNMVLSQTWAGLSRVSGQRFHAHNGFIDLFLQLGFVGLFLFLLHFLKFTVRLFQLLNTKPAVEHFWMILVIFLMFFFNLSETITILATNNILWILYSSISFSTALQLDRIRKDQAKLKATRQFHIPNSEPA